MPADNNSSDQHAPWWQSLVAGGSSAVFSRLLTYPPDTIKSRLQVQGAVGNVKLYTSTADAFVKIAKTEGVGGFYRGFGAIVLTVIPANMCYFSGYELGKRISPRDWGTASDLITGIIAQTVAGIVFCPIDIVKQRVQTANVMDSGPSGRITPLQAAKEVWNYQGMKGFFRGYWTMNALWMPWNLIYLTTYEASKRKVYKWQLHKMRKQTETRGAVSDSEYKHTAPLLSKTPKKKEEDDSSDEPMLVLTDPPMSQVLPAWAFPLCSSSCAALAAVCTHPIDVVKTRLQVLTAAEKGLRRRSALQVAAELWQQEGMKGFTRGIGPRIGTLSIGSSASWFCYEMVKRHLERNFPWR